MKGKKRGTNAQRFPFPRGLLPLPFLPSRPVPVPGDLFCLYDSFDPKVPLGFPLESVSGLPFPFLFHPRVVWDSGRCFRSVLELVRGSLRRILFLFWRREPSFSSLQSSGSRSTFCPDGTSRVRVRVRVSAPSHPLTGLYRERSGSSTLLPGSPVPFSWAGTCREREFT